MANLTLVIDDQTLRKARIKALELGTSVNAVVREQLDRFVEGDTQARAAIERLIARSELSSAGGDGDGRRWSRDELYEDRLGKWNR